MLIFKKRLKLSSTISTPSWWKMVANKVRRTYLCYFNPDYVKENEAARVGECVGCGKCCTLVFKCVFLQGSEEQARCKIYDLGRPKPCGAFPIDPKDLADVNFLCGYSFVTPSEAKTPVTVIPPIEVTPPMEPSFTLIRKIEPASKAGERGKLHPALPVMGAHIGPKKGQQARARVRDGEHPGSTQGPLIEVNLISE